MLCLDFDAFPAAVRPVRRLVGEDNAFRTAADFPGVRLAPGLVFGVFAELPPLFVFDVFFIFCANFPRSQYTVNLKS